MKILGHATWNSFLTFAVVRNPYDWFVSQFAYNLRKAGVPVPVGRQLSPSDVQRCLELLRPYRGINESDYATQWAFVCNGDRSPAVDVLLPLERLESIWPTLIDRLGVIGAASPPYRNASLHPHWEAWLSQAARSLVAEMWDDDFRLHSIARTIVLERQ